MKLSYLNSTNKHRVRDNILSQVKLKQVIGLGIMVKKNMSTAEKIRKGIRGDKNFAVLPEA